MVVLAMVQPLVQGGLPPVFAQVGGGLGGGMAIGTVVRVVT
jgi:hypothetical protein